MKYLLALGFLGMAYADEVCTSEDDFRGNEWARYSGQNTDRPNTVWVPPDTSNSPYDQSKITNPDQWNGATYDNSFTFDRQTFANECARGCAAAETGHNEMYINYESGVRYSCYCMGGGGVPTHVPNEPANKKHFAAKYTCTGETTASTCDDASALNHGAEGACLFEADLKGAKAAAAATALKAKLADPSKKLEAIATIKAQVDKSTAGDRATVKATRRQQLKDWGVDASNWKGVEIVDTNDFAGYTANVLAKRRGRDIKYRFVPVGDHTVEISPGGAINAAQSTDIPLESFDLDVNACLTIIVGGGNIRVCKDNNGELTVACDNGAPVGRSAGDAVQCLGYEWDVGSLTLGDGGCVPNASPDTNGVCTCNTGYETNEAGDACVEAPPAAGGAVGGSCDPSTCTGCTPAEYINAQCCNCA